MGLYAYDQRWCIYILLDADENPKYVGQCVNLRGRLRCHWTSRFKATTPVAEWIRTLDQPPAYVVAHEAATRGVFRTSNGCRGDELVDGNELACAMERAVIEQLRCRGYDLLNVSVPYAAMDLSKFGKLRLRNGRRRAERERAEVRRREVANG